MVRTETIIAASFRGLDVHGTLARLWASDSGDERILFVDDRVRLVRSVIATRPSLVLFPVQDVHGDLSGPLIARLRREAPDIASAVLIRYGEPAHGVLDAVRDGASICYWKGETDLVDSIRAFGALESSPRSDPTVIRALLVGLHPDHCVHVLAHCTEFAHRRLRVEDVAHEFRVSRRSLSRWMRLASWPVPAELIEWARLLRASVVQWRDESNVAALARASGFSDPASLRRAASLLLKSQLPMTHALTPLLVTTMLRRRLESLSRGQVTDASQVG